MRPSLTRRLLIFYSATIFVVVSVTSGLVWFLMRRTLHQGLDETLRSEAAALAGRVEVDRGVVEFEERTNLTQDQEQAAPLVQIVDDRRRVVFASPALAYDETLIERATQTVPMAEPWWFTMPLDPDEEPFRVAALHIIVRPEEDAVIHDAEIESAGVWIFAARSLAPIDQTLAQLASVLALAVGVSMLGALMGGFLVTRRGTRPVLDLADKLGLVNPKHPELHLNLEQVPTELEPIVQTTERLLERVRNELTRQRQLTADVAHDLRTPVAGVRTLLDVCLQRERSSREYVSAIENARAALRELSRLLDDVLTLSRLDARVDQPIRTQVQLDDVLGAAVATVQPLAGAREVSIMVTKNAPLEFSTDRGKLVKIVQNLLSNAVEHSPPRTAVHMNAQRDNGVLEIAITDRGPGIPSELRDRIFDRFVRGDEARAGKDGHHGLGLPIAAGLARLLDGEVKLDPRHEAGSRFVVRLRVK